jgi:hypothetical protein
MLKKNKEVIHDQERKVERNKEIIQDLEKKIRANHGENVKLR